MPAELKRAKAGVSWIVHPLKTRKQTQAAKSKPAPSLEAPLQRVRGVPECHRQQPPSPWPAFQGRGKRLPAAMQSHGFQAEVKLPVQFKYWVWLPEGWEAPASRKTYSCWVGAGPASGPGVDAQRGVPAGAGGGRLSLARNTACRRGSMAPGASKSSRTCWSISAKGRRPMRASTSGSLPRRL